MASLSLVRLAWGSLQGDVGLLSKFMCIFSAVMTVLLALQMHRMDLADHLRHSILEHQLLMVQSVDALTANVWNAASAQSQERNTTFTWVFTDFKRYLDGSKNRLFSEPFYVGKLHACGFVI